MNAESSKSQDLELLVQIGQVFRPSAPVDNRTTFAGRVDQLRSILSAVTQPGQHAVVYGERGVGKTSLVNIVSMMVEAVSVQSISVNCDSGDTFPTLWTKVFREIEFDTSVKRPGFLPGEDVVRRSLVGYVNDTTGPEEIRLVLSRLGKRLVIVFDELDRIKDRGTTTLLADTIKTLSDHSVDVTLVLVGVAESVSDLIAEHNSIERAVVQIEMPRMSSHELIELMNKALSELKMTMPENEKHLIAKLAQGLPHYVHLICFHMAQFAVMDGRTDITSSDREKGIAESVKHVQHSVASVHHKATLTARRDTIYKEVLLACALSETDDKGYFSAGSVREPLTRITGRRYEIPAFARHLNEFSTDSRGQILQKIGVSRRNRYRFTSPLMRPYLILSGLTTNMIKAEDV